MFTPPSYKSNRYTSLGKQPLHIRFDFKPKHAHRSSVGYVVFTIYVADREYGPYLTDIWTTTNAYEGRRRCYITGSSLVVQEKIIALYEKLEDGYDSYNKWGEQPITGEMVLAKSGLQERQGEGGLHYAL